MELSYKEKTDLEKETLVSEFPPEVELLKNKYLWISNLMCLMFSYYLISQQ